MTPALKIAPEEHRGFRGLKCIRCSSTDAVEIDLADLTGPEAVTCRECENSFALSEVCRVVTAWAAVLAWATMAPATKD